MGTKITFGVIGENRSAEFLLMMNPILNAGFYQFDDGTFVAAYDMTLQEAESLIAECISQMKFPKRSLAFIHLKSSLCTVSVKGRDL